MDKDQKQAEPDAELTREEICFNAIHNALDELKRAKPNDRSEKDRLYAVTITRRGPPAFRGQEPYLVATVELDERVRLLTQIVNCKTEDARIGMRVRVHWRALNDEFLFPVFEPDV